MNTVCLTGRLGGDPEMKYTPAGLAVTKFSLAVERRAKSDEGERQVDWFDVTCFGQSAEFAGQYLDKGALVGIEGRLQQDKWEGDDGQKRSKVVIVAGNVTPLESKQEAEARRGSRPNGANEDAT